MSESLGIGRARQWLEEDPNRVYGSILPLSRDKSGGGLRLALPTAARDLGRGVLDMLEGHMTPEASMALLDVPTGGLMRAAAIGARAPATQLGIFAGVGAKTANKAALETAQRMASEGADPRAIWRDTGWFQGPEGKWRWEIDDSGATVNRKSFQTSEWSPQAWTPERSMVGGVYHHNDLYKAYPELRKARAGVNVSPDNPDSGRWSGWKREMDVDASSWDNARSIGLHELQHGVQGEEGFAAGGNPEAAFGLREKPALDAIRAERKALGIDPYAIQNRKAAGFFVSPEDAAAFSRWQELVAEEDEILAGALTGREAYRRLAGEAEARAVQKRMDMTPEQRRATFPLDSYDVPLDELIVRGAEVDPEFRRLWLQGKAT